MRHIKLALLGKVAFSANRIVLLSGKRLESKDERESGGIKTVAKAPQSDWEAPAAIEPVSNGYIRRGRLGRWR